MKPLEIFEDTPYFPASAALEVTLRCNMHCLHCGSSATKNPRANELTLEEWKSIINQLIQQGTEIFTLSGGEPFMYEYWRDLATYITNAGKKLSIISNGYAITESDIEFLGTLPTFLNVALSVDGLEKTHDSIRLVPNAFQRVTETIRRFVKAKLKVGVVTSVNQKNFQELPALRDFLDSIGVDLWQVQIVTSFGRAKSQKDTLLITPEQYAALVEFVYNSQQQYKKENRKMRVMPADSVGYCYGIAEKIWGDLAWNGCNAGKYALGIQSNGNVTGCLSLQDPEFVAGNLREKSLAEIWNDDANFSYNRKFSEKDLCGYCAACDKGAACKGGCIAVGKAITSQFHNNPYCYSHFHR